MLQLQNKLMQKLVVLMMLLMALVACNNRPSGVIDESDMTDILTEMHTLDGVLVAKGLQYGNNDAKQHYYDYILKKYDVSRAEFDTSLVWYTKNPKKFVFIYDDVLERLSTLENEVRSNKYHPIDSIELAKRNDDVWNKDRKYHFSEDSVRTRLNFEIKNPTFLLGDVYELKFLQRIAPADSSKNPQVVLRINYANGKKDSVYAISHNDSLLRRFTLRLPALRRLKIKSISGDLLGSKVYKGKFNAELDSIVLLRHYNTRYQDSLKKVVEKHDSKKYLIPAKEKKDSINKLELSVKEKLLNGK